jgi:hypothetical protein
MQLFKSSFGTPSNSAQWQRDESEESMVVASFGSFSDFLISVLPR